MTDSPIGAATAAFHAVDAGDWQALFAVLDPVAIERFKSYQRRILEMSESAGLFRRRKRPGGMLQQVFAVSSLDEYDALPAAFVLRRWLVVSRGRFQHPERPETHREMLGEVHEGPGMAHVVFRESWSGGEELVARVRVISARRTERGWRIELGGGLVLDEGGGAGIGYSPGTDPTEGESDFTPPIA